LDIHALNDELRRVLFKLENKGYKKTDIGRLLLGSNGYSPISKFLSDSTSKTEFGIKPLGRIAEQAGYRLELSLVKKGNESNNDIIEVINEQNSAFFEELPVLIERYLNKEYNQNMQKTRSSKSSKAIDAMLSELGI